MVLTNQKLFIISDEVNETIDLKDIETIYIGIFGIECRLKKKFDHIYILLQVEDIVRIETIAEKFGIPVKKYDKMLGKPYETHKWLTDYLQLFAIKIYRKNRYPR